LVLAVGSVAASVGWVMRDHEARRAKLHGDFARSLERAELLQAQNKRAEAFAALERCQQLGAEAAPEPALWERFLGVKADLEAREKDDVFQTSFKRIRLEDLTPVDPERNTFAISAVYPSLCEMFRQYGIEIGVTPLAEILARIKGRPEAVQMNLVAALDECCRFAPAEDTGAKTWILAALHAIDDNRWRASIRDALAAKDKKALALLAGEIDVSQQSPSFLVLIVRSLPAKEPATLDLARRVQRAYPGDFWANHYFAIELRRNGRPAEAVPYCMAGLALRPNNAGAYLNLALAHREAKSLDEALADLDAAIKLLPTYTMAWRVRGGVLAGKREFQAALDSLAQAAILDPRSGSIHSSRGRLFIELKDFAAAVSEYEEAVRLGQDDAETHSDLAYALRMQGHLKESEAEYQKAIDLQPDSAHPHYNLGILLCEDKHDYAAAAGEFRKACQLSPDYGSAHLNLGVALSHLRQFKAAELELREAIRLKADHANAHNMLGGALAHQDKFNEAIGEFRTAIRLEPRVALTHFNLGRALEPTEDWAGAVASYEEALRLRPNYLDCSINLALLLANCPEAKLRDANRALQVARQAVALAAKADRTMQRKAWQALGCALYRKSNWKESLEALEKAVALEDSSGSALKSFFFAMNYWQLGQPDEARRHYDRAMLWMKQNAADAKRLRGIQAEATALLKIEDE
jgi:tetratricopeptide (TPR) repeat protein